MIKVSENTFIVLAYKESPFLELCILSLLNQTVKSEIIISTSTPNDLIKKISDKYKLEIIVNSISNGIGSDWNFAYKLAKTKFVTLAHQDDIYEPTYTEFCINFANKFGDTLIVFTDYNEIILNKLESRRIMLQIKRMLLFPFKFTDILRNNFLKKFILSFGNPISCPSVMYNKENLRNFNFLENMKTNMDWCAWLEIAKMKGGIVCVPKRLTNHRIHSDSETSNTINNNTRYFEDSYIFEQIWGKAISVLLMKIYKYSYKSNFEKI